MSESSTLDLGGLGGPGVEAVVVTAGVRTWRLPFTTPFVNARGPVLDRPGLLLRVETDDGAIGWGEAAPLDGFSVETIDTAAVALDRWCAAAVGRPLGDLPAVGTSGGGTARSAVVSAAVDLLARLAGCTVADLLAHPARARATVATNLVLGTVDPDEAARAAVDGVGRGHRTVKLKVGHGAVDDDLRLVEAVRTAVGTDTAIRIDANGAWSEAEAIRALEQLARYSIEYVEDPVLGPEALARVRAASAVPIALDEPLRVVEVLDAHLAAGAIDIAVLKPTALGGPVEAMALARRADAAGVGTIVTSFLDAAVGRAAALAVTAAIPEQGAAGLATGGLLAADLAVGHRIVGGDMAVGSTPGLGVEPDWDALA